MRPDPWRCPHCRTEWPVPSLAAQCERACEIEQQQSRTDQEEAR